MEIFKQTVVGSKAEIQLSVTSALVYICVFVYAVKKTPEFSLKTYETHVILSLYSLLPCKCTQIQEDLPGVCDNIHAQFPLDSRQS